MNILSNKLQINAVIFYTTFYMYQKLYIIGHLCVILDRNSPACNGMEHFKST